jgi:hypothetical protein
VASSPAGAASRRAAWRPRGQQAAAELDGAYHPHRRQSSIRACDRAPLPGAFAAPACARADGLACRGSRRGPRQRRGGGATPGGGGRPPLCRVSPSDTLGAALCLLKRQAVVAVTEESRYLWDGSSTGQLVNTGHRPAATSSEHLAPRVESHVEHVQRTAHSAQRTAHSAQRTAHSAQRTAHTRARASAHAGTAWFYHAARVVLAGLATPAGA